MFPEIARVTLIDVDVERARRAARNATVLLERSGLGRAGELDISFGSMNELEQVLSSDVIVTTTYGVAAYGASPVLDLAASKHLNHGTFIAAIGADLVGKR